MQGGREREREDVNVLLILRETERVLSSTMGDAFCSAICMTNRVYMQKGGERERSGWFGGISLPDLYPL